MDWTTKREIRSEITNRLEAGDTKSNIFNSLTTKYGPNPIIKGILSDIPSSSVKARLKLVNLILVSILLGIALFKGYFIILGLSLKSGTTFLMFTTFVIQVLLVWMVIKSTRMAYLATAFYSLIQIFEYQNGYDSTISTVKILCVVITVLLVFAIGISSYLYIKSNEKWNSTNKASQN